MSGFDQSEFYTGVDDPPVIGVPEEDILLVKGDMEAEA